MIFEVGHKHLWKDEWFGTKVFLDGREIKGVFFVDTDRGIVQTFDVMHDGSAATAVDRGDGTFWRPEDFPGREVECGREDVLNETLRGVVTLQFPDGSSI